MKALITGGAGFIGSHLVDRLLQDGYEVVVIDHRLAGKPHIAESDAVTYIEMDISDPALEQVFLDTRPDVVFHLAAQISVTQSLEDPVADAMVNIVGAIKVLDYAKDVGVKKFVFTSSGGAIYGDHPERPTPEIMHAQPLSPYGIAKQSFEHYLEHYAEVHGVDFVAVRFSNVYGPRQMPGGYAGVISIFIDHLLHGKTPTIFGDGTSTRDYVYVEDAVDAMVKAAESTSIGIVNIGTGVETSVNDLWNILREIHGGADDAMYAPARPGEVYRSVIYAEKAEEHIGWTVQTALADGLRATYMWFKHRG